MKLIRRISFNEEDKIMFRDIREMLKDKYLSAYFEKVGKISNEIYYKISNEIYYKTDHLIFTHVNYRSNMDATKKMNATQMFKVEL